MRKLYSVLLFLFAASAVSVAQPCNADFTIQMLSNTNAKFTPAVNSDSAHLHHEWSFGDGTAVSGTVSPSHTYAPGTYTVKHFLTRHDNAGVLVCLDSTFRQITIAGTCNLQAAFIIAIAPNNPREIIITNTSVGLGPNDSIRWNFGDGTTSNQVNPSHVYANPGTYNVCVRIQKREANGTTTNCVSELCHAVTIAGPTCNIHPTYTYHRDSLNYRKIYFTNTTATSTSNAVSWNFGDGSTSTIFNPIHEYAQPGRYYVCLTVTDGNCTATHCDSITIVQPTTINCANIYANFGDHRDSILHNRVTFIAISNAPILDQTWTIHRLPSGSTITLHANNPTYLFSDTGLYNVCLRAVFAQGCVKEVCHTIHITNSMSTNVCNMQVYPNPAHNVINAAVNLTSASTIHAFIYNSMGTVVGTKVVAGVVGSNIITMNVETLPIGVYTIRVEYEGHSCSAVFYKQ